MKFNSIYLKGVHVDNDLGMASLDTTPLSRQLQTSKELKREERNRQTGTGWKELKSCTCVRSIDTLNERPSAVIHTH